MPDNVSPPESFDSLGPDERGRVPIIERLDLDRADVEPILDEIASVPWADLCHTYGSAADVPNQLAAIAVGDAETRKAAWWNLWGSIHHQGTIYEAAVAAAPILARLGEWPSYPDRAEAIFFLEALARADGVVVWHYGSEREVVHDEPAQAARSEQLRTIVNSASERLLASWKSSPREVRRALIFLLTSLPTLRPEYTELVDAELPDRLRRAWLQAAENPRIVTDEIDDLERWAYPSS